MTDNSLLNDYNKNNQILLIDNYPRGSPSDRITRIETIVADCISKVELKTVHFTQFKFDMAENTLGIILSGSELNVSDFYNDIKLEKRFMSQLELIRQTTQTPILALCFGFHLVAYAYGAQISRMRMLGLEGRIIFILLKKTDDIITRKNIPVNVHHLDFVSPNDCKIQKYFEIISSSRTMGYKMVQYMRHVNKPIFALQFHPETHNPYHFQPSLFDERIANKTRLMGEKIIENFIWLCSNKKSHPE
jgi:GMP synthase-like glutamine amidotransferase